MGRALGFIGTLAALAVSIYFYSLQVKTLQPSSGTAPNNEAAVITGVKTDLIGIANAERGYLAAQGKYASLDELISGNYIAINGARAPYTYDIQITSGGFSATATRATKSAPAQLSITENMEIQSSD